MLMFESTGRLDTRCAKFLKRGIEKTANGNEKHYLHMRVTDKPCLIYAYDRSLATTLSLNFRGENVHFLWSTALKKVVMPPPFLCIIMLMVTEEKCRHNIIPYIICYYHCYLH